MTALPAGIERDVALSRFTTIGTGGPAAFLGEPKDDLALVEMLRWAQVAEQAIAVIGLGSNLLPADTGFDGLVLRLDGELARIEVRENGAVLGGGASLAAAVRRVGDAGLAGFEFACAIPGTMGGAVRMNAGAYGREIVDVLVTATISSAAGTRTVLATELGLTYRHSELADGEIVTAAEIVLTPDDPVLIKERVR